MIPKIIHQMWIGNNPVINEEYLSFIRGWQEMYPDYNYEFWDSDKVLSRNIIPEDKHQYYFSKKWPTAFRADILRYEILRKMGGIYIDIDMEPIKRWDDKIIDNVFFAGSQHNGEVCISILGSVPDCELIEDVCDKIVPNIELLRRMNVSPNCVDQYTGPVFFTRKCRPYLKNPMYSFFPPSMFYPYSWEEPHRRHENFKVTCPEAYAVHHWAHDWWS